MQTVVYIRTIIWLTTLIFTTNENQYVVPFTSFTAKGIMQEGEKKIGGGRCLHFNKNYENAKLTTLIWIPVLGDLPCVWETLQRCWPSQAALSLSLSFDATRRKRVEILSAQPLQKVKRGLSALQILVQDLSGSSGGAILSWRNS